MEGAEGRSVGEALHPGGDVGDSEDHGSELRVTWPCRRCEREFRCDRCCFSVLREVVEGIPTPDPRHPELLLWHEGAIEIFYTPFDWMNVSAKVMLVGITPGLYQATKALECAKACLAAQMSDNETLRQVDATGSFAGPMRRNLVTMLDGIGLPEALGLTTTERLFDSGHDLVDHASAISYPVFVGGGNYAGSNPPLLGQPILRSSAKAWLGASVNMAEGALVIPLGTVATEAVEMLVAEGLLDRGRGLLGVPHPSGANGWRARQYAERRQRLQQAVATWANGS